MSKSDRWLLPDGVEELLPPQAWSAESLRRKLLDLYRLWGYELISPPLIEYLESLLTGTGNDLDLQTFKVTDQLTGRLMGVRADITPQAARIDAHCWKKKGVSRLCYADSVLHTTPENQMTGRSPIQVGCELFGSRSLASDIEIIRLMIETIAMTGSDQLHLDLSHVGLFKGLIADIDISADNEKLLTDAVRRKSLPDVSALLAEMQIAASAAERLKSLPGLIGGIEILDTAQDLFADANEAATAAIAELKQICQHIAAMYPNLSISIDLADLRGYHYHTGLVFTGYVKGCGRVLAKGGRYDAIGQVFGRARAATGFSCDLKSLVEIANVEEIPRAIYAPAASDAELIKTVASLRITERVIQGFEDDKVTPAELGCDRVLVKTDSGWVVEAI